MLVDGFADGEGDYVNACRDEEAIEEEEFPADSVAVGKVGQCAEWEKHEENEGDGAAGEGPDERDRGSPDFDAESEGDVAAANEREACGDFVGRGMGSGSEGGGEGQG